MTDGKLLLNILTTIIKLLFYFLYTIIDSKHCSHDYKSDTFP